LTKMLPLMKHVDDPGFPQILDQIVDITAPVLGLHVTAGVESVEQDVGVASVFRKSGRNLIADQEVGVVQECEGPVSWSVSVTKAMPARFAIRYDSSGSVYDSRTSPSSPRPLTQTFVAEPEARECRCSQR
jgi:hypothetical protein